MKANLTLLYQLWTKAVGTTGYVREQWVRLEEHLNDFERIVAEQKVELYSRKEKINR